MRIQTLALFLLICPIFVMGQIQIKRYIKENSFPISTIEPGSSDFTDLQAIGDAIGERKIVMLGEQDHGDAATFLAKSRLVKYLHEEKGFNVLAFEADFFSLNYNWNSVINKSMPVEALIRRNISHYWTECDATIFLFNDYIPACLQKNDSLVVSGFDTHMGTQSLIPLLDSVMRHFALPITTNPEYTSEIYPLLLSWYNHTEDTAAVNKIVDYYKEIKLQLAEKLSSSDFWIQAVDNLIAQNIHFKYREKDYWKSINTRDQQMALNLKWLNEVKYPNEKIIVWAHNYHVSKNSGNFPDKFLKHQVSMTSAFTADSVNRAQTYVIGFTSYQGKTGRMFEKIYKVQKPKPNSFENWIDKSYNYAFVDFDSYNKSNMNKSEKFYMKGSLHGNIFHKNFKAEWTRVFDGVMYLKDMYPCAN